jgi:hypothetical protein
LVVEDLAMELVINADLFRNSDSTEFVNSICNKVKEAQGNFVLIYGNGKLLGYAISPESPLWKDIIKEN